MSHRRIANKAICNQLFKLAQAPEKVVVTYRARSDMFRLKMTKRGVCQAIYDWIDSGNPVQQEISYHLKHDKGYLYVLYPEIDEKKRYIKVKIEEPSGDKMIIVSAHEYHFGKGGEN